jgi:hypothetical protein
MEVASDGDQERLAERPRVAPVSYRYTPLLEAGNIRLLCLLPHRNTNAPIQCEIFEYPLRKLVKGPHLYEALSYVWGSEENKLPIYVQPDERRNDGSFGDYLLVTTNLHVALAQLRNHYLERIIWVDAICINQTDDDEKGLQVQSMAEIYASANRVVVWLGETSSNSDTAFDELRKAAKKDVQVWQPLPEKSLADAVFAVLERPWFQRIWVCIPTRQ